MPCSTVMSCTFSIGACWISRDKRPTFRITRRFVTTNSSRFARKRSIAKAARAIAAKAAAIHTSGLPTSFQACWFLAV